MIPRLRPSLGLAELTAALLPAGRGAVAEFETRFAALAGQAHAVAFPHGRTGLWCLLKAMGLAGGEVLCPAYTCVVVPHAVVLSGNEPVFVDAAADDDPTMDLELASQAVTPATGAILATSVFGRPVDLDALDRFRRRHPQVAVIQDCAHAFIASWQGRPVPREGTAALFGLNLSKTITSIFGGMITTDDAALYARLRAVRDEHVRPAGLLRALRQRAYLLAGTAALCGPAYGLVHALERSGLLDRFCRYYDEGRIDLPADAFLAMTAVGARIGLRQCQRYDAIIAQRRAAAARYGELLAQIPGLALPVPVPGATWSHYAPRLRDPARRDAVLKNAARRGVQLGRLIEYSIPAMPAYRDRAGARSCPVAAGWAAAVINLPVWGGAALAERVAPVLRQAVADD